MKVLGIDYGSKRVGIALSDEGRQFAIPHSVIKNSKTLLEEVVAVTQKEGTTEVVMGESKNYEGGANSILEESLSFKKQLEGKGLKVTLEPEFMTSANAERFQGKTNLLDASAAALILQSFLDKERVKG